MILICSRIKIKQGSTSCSTKELDVLPFFAFWRMCFLAGRIPVPCTNMPRGRRIAVVYQILSNFLDSCNKIISPHKSIFNKSQRMCFYFGKNAFSALRPLWMLKDLCGNKWSYAFFGAVSLRKRDSPFSVIRHFSIFFGWTNCIIPGIMV